MIISVSEGEPLRYFFCFDFTFVKKYDKMNKTVDKRRKICFCI